jgi:hypothetical protein
MGRKILSLITVLVLSSQVFAQREATVYDGEIGISLGMAHYFGDLNNRASFNRFKPAIGAFYRKQVGNYVGVRLGFHYAQLGYSDVYSDNEFQKTRNLSFNSSVWEIAVQGDFNFFKFVPGDPDHMFTPYVTLGIGIFGYDPYAYLDNQKYYLRALGTEGQGSSSYPDREVYGNTAFSFPIGMGIKYNISPSLNFAFEISHRFTGTDYLDDVSSTYAGPAVFEPGTPAFFLQDRSYELGPPIGQAGRQRGFSSQKDQYLFIEASLAFTLSSYRCPTPGR